MDPQLDTRLKAIEEKVDQNHKILAKMRRGQQAGNVVRFLYWGFLIFAGFGAYYFIQPYLGQLGAAYGITGGQDNAGGSGGILDQLKQLKDLTGQNQTQ